MLLNLTLGDRRVVVRNLEPEDEKGLLTLFEASDDWFTAATGQPAGPGDVQSLYYSLPEGAAFEDKELLVITADDQVVGVIDAVLRHPDAGTCSVGLFLVHPAHRRQGLGRLVAAALLEELAARGFGEVSGSVAEGRPPGREFAAGLGFSLGPARAPGTANRNAVPDERPVLPARLRLPPTPQ